LVLEDLEARLVPSNSVGGITAPGLTKAQQSTYVQTNLVSDVAGLAQVQDTNLKNPWGVSFGPATPFWVSDQGTNKSTLYTVKNGVASVNGLVVGIPTNPGPPNGPTGQVFNSTTASAADFKIPVSAGGNGNRASFIFDGLNGIISAWNGGANAINVATGAPGSVYTGLALGTNGTNNYLFAANGVLKRIDVFDGAFAPVTLGANGFGTFTDPLLPSALNLVPFNVQNIGGKIYVTYAPAGRAAQTGATEGQGAVVVFDTTGHLLEQLIAGSKLASPWGITMAPASFGPFGGDLLVGNFAYNVSEINAFDPKTGKFLGTLMDATGQKIENQALWALTFGNGGNGGDPNTLYFTAGINGENDGLFGQIQATATIKPGKDAIVPNLPKTAEQTFSTVPANGDQNPYGVAFVPLDIKSGGVLQPGDLLVSNFNNKGDANNPGGLQGTGTTILRITPSGATSVFFTDTMGQGFSTALGVLKSGFVIAGEVPTTDGTFNTIGQGDLLILRSDGTVAARLTSKQFLNGPWDLTINDQGSTAQVFVSNVLSGTVTRIDLNIPKTGDPKVVSMTQIASGYKVKFDPQAVVLGPTGLAYDAQHDILYVASTADNAVYAISNAGDTKKDGGKGKLIYNDPAHLNGPLGLVLAPNGDLITTNGDAFNPDSTVPPSLIVEITTKGQFVGQFQLDTKPDAPFGIAIQSVNGSIRFAAVNDNANSVEVWTFAVPFLKKHNQEGDDFGGDD
jgi:uncharacterized protein (TIGR03118 family)